jgi:hypothetical protein
MAEIAFPLWLLIMGVNAEQWEKRALESALLVSTAIVRLGQGITELAPP